MKRVMLLAALTLVPLPAFVSPSSASAQEMVMSAPAKKTDSATSVYGGASGIFLVTRASPAIHDRTLTEGYLSQPMLMGGATFPRYGLNLSATINLEGLTLKRGELNAGMSGEGYIDRRHPHTYLHEIVATWKRSVGSDAQLSATAGKGFAPFGTDDPMMRPFVKYPVNHHLAQIPERAIGVVAASRGPIAVELSRFNGDEPEGPSDFPNSSRLFDSWAGRVTARVQDAAEFQASYANVISPEIAAGGGLDQKKWSTSARYESAKLYGLAEYAHTQEVESGRNAFAYRSMLAEGSLTNRGTVLAARIEQTDRAEEERLSNEFRTPRPASDLSILGRTRWTIATVNVSRSFTVSKAQLAPFIEVGRAHAASIDRFAAFNPASFYGSDVMWSISAGLRFGFGMMHNRMGRYGAALPKASMKMGNMEGMDMGQ